MKVVLMNTPNVASRGQRVPLDTVVLHSTAGSLQGALAWLSNPKSRVSAHYVVAKDGTVYKLAPVSLATFHAGGRWSQLKHANRRSIGIELEQMPGENLSPAQWNSLRALLRQLKQNVPTLRYLVGHREINPHKSDPYGVDLVALRKEFRMENPLEGGQR